MVARLNDEQLYVRAIASDILIHSPEEFRHALYTEHIVISLFKTLLERSFARQFSVYIIEGNLYINMPDDIKEIPISIQQNVVKELIKNARPADYPLTRGGESSFYNESY